MVPAPRSRSVRRQSGRAAVPGSAGRYLEKHGLPITYLDTSKFSPATLPALLGIMRRLKPDLLHLHGYGAGNFGRLAARSAGAPAVVHEHFVDPRIPLDQQFAEAMLEPLAAHTVAVFRSVKEFCVTKRRIDPERISVIYNGVPLDQFAPPAVETAEARKQALGVPDGAKVVGYVGRLHEQKGVEFLVKAVPKIIQSTRTLASSSSATAPCGTPLTVFEAMALCKPIVATPVDGLGEVLVDRRTALLIPPRDAAAIADAVNRLLAEPGLRRDLSDNCRVERHRFDISGTVHQLEDLYDRILDRDHGH